jgi:16S rRNA processing protein RimM
MGAYIKVARISKVRKRQGRLVVQSCDGLPFLLEAGMTVHIVPPSLDVPRMVTVQDVRQAEEDTITLREVDDYPRLVEYVGRYCLVARADVDAELLASSAGASFGFQVVDDRFGELGRVEDVMEDRKSVGEGKGVG